MSKKNKILLFSIFFTVLSTAFLLSYRWGITKFNTYGNNSKKNSNISSSDIGKITAAVSMDDTVSPNAKITIKTEYSKSGSIESKEVKTSDYTGKSKTELENQGYIVESITPAQVTLLKKVDSYAPNKYVLGVKDNCFAIYKTDETGEMFIEDESTDVTDISVPTKGDYNLLTKGSKDFQFNTREEAEEKLGEYSS